MIHIILHRRETQWPTSVVSFKTHSGHEDGGFKRFYCCCTHASILYNESSWVRLDTKAPTRDVSPASFVVHVSQVTPWAVGHSPFFDSSCRA